MDESNHLSRYEQIIVLTVIFSLRKENGEGKSMDLSLFLSSYEQMIGLTVIFSHGKSMVKD